MVERVWLVTHVDRFLLLCIYLPISVVVDMEWQGKTRQRQRQASQTLNPDGKICMVD